MGHVCGCLKNVKGISVQAYHSEDVEDRCVCGKPFASPDANFCCHCGASREGHPPAPQRKYSHASDTSRQSSGSKFSNIMPGTVPSASRTNRRAGTGGSATPSVSSRTTVDEASEDQTSDDRLGPPSDRHASRHNSGASRSTKDSISVASDKTGESSPKKPTSGLRSPASGSPRCTKPPKEPRTTSLEVGHEDMVSALSKALKHSGSLVTTSVQMRALQAPDGLGAAFNFKPRPDTQMPPFEAKVDQDNLLKMLPQGSLKANQLSLQRVTFMSTEWLGLRLAQGTHSQCISFCLCVIALQNIGKNTSRSVVVETSTEEAVQLGFACAPIIGQKKSKCSTAFLDHAEDISELAQIFLNDDGNQKKVTAELKKWCQKTQRKLVGNDPASDDNSRSKTFSLRGLFASIEESLGALGSEGNANKIQGGRRNSNASINGEPRSRRDSNASIGDDRRSWPQDRRKSLPPGLETSSAVRKFTPEGKPTPKSRSNDRGRSSGGDRQSSKSKRSHASYDSNDGQSIDSSSRHSSPQISERRRRNSDPGLPSMMGLSDEETVVAMKMKRKKSFDAAIMPTLNEDEDSESKEAALATMPALAVGRSSATVAATQNEKTSIAIPTIPES